MRWGVKSSFLIGTNPIMARNSEKSLISGLGELTEGES